MLILETRQIYRFGEWSLNANACVLLRNGQPVRLARKPVETLLALAEHPDEILTKEELIQTIWQGRVVDEANLLQNIAVIRKTLAVAPGQPGYIETFPGRGYRLVGPIHFKEETVPSVDKTHDQAAPKNEVIVAALETASSAPPAGPRTFRPRTLALLAGLAVVVAGITIWASVRPRQVREAAFVPLYRRAAVARLSGKEYQPAISPDGKSVAFILDRFDNQPPMLWVADGKGLLSKLGEEGWEYSSPAWAPDGKSVAALRFRFDRGEAIVTDLGKHTERVVTAIRRPHFGLADARLAWSPDGRTLAVADSPSANGPLALSLLTLESRELRQIAEPPADTIGDVNPRFSPDGKSLLFIRIFHRSRQGLLLANLANLQLKQLTGSDFQIGGCDWASDPTSVVYSSNGTGDFRLWRLQAFAKSREPKPDPTGIYADAPFQVATARLGGSLVYSVLHQDFNIWSLDLRPKHKQETRWSRVVSSSAQDASPQYSPDGSEICFRSDRTGQEQLWVSDAKGTNARQITQGVQRPSVGRWAPDGQAVIFNDSRDRDMYLAQRERNGEWSVRPLGQKGTHPVILPDGTTVIAGIPGGISQFQLRFTLTPGNQLAATQGLSFGTAFDDHSVLFVREAADTNLLHLDTTTHRTTKFLTGLIPYCSSCWAVSKLGVYYLGSKPGSITGQAIYFHDRKSGAENEVCDFPERLAPLGGGPFSLSPDGRYLLCVRGDASNSDVMRVEPIPAS
ncbi:MAG TPA: winged helix-turn-helix domain-containing protein [Bryobacteraceae bacterium]|nr:winged helix-turn-helix domain-containing protein [Bryobacteraceae bacterium]